MVEFRKLDEIEPGTQLEALTKAQLRDLQRALAFIGFNLGVIDGLIGPKTRNAWAEFVDEVNQGNPTVVADGALDALGQRIVSLNGALDANLANTAQVKSAIGAVCVELGIGRRQQIAYALATAQWETNHTFQPVKEAYWLSETWRKNNFHYYPYYGRGYVQLTWKRNYEKYRDILNVGMVENPDLALDPKTSLFVIAHGFKTGTFTERKITEFINESMTDYKNARKCINGLDKWDEIKKLAEQYEEEL